MFSSNQVFKISGDMNQLQTVLKFAFKMNGEDEHISQSEYDRGYKIIYQISDDEMSYCIGHCFGEIPKGWQEYPFRFDYEICSRIIAQFLESFDIQEDCWDGSYEKGFIAENIEQSFADKEDGIVKPFYGTIRFRAFTTFYSK